MTDTRPHVVIIGGGFGGIYAARSLKRANVRITLIDKRNHHLFQPLLYQVATAGLGAPDISAPIRKILEKQRNVTVLLADAKHIDTAEKAVHTNRGVVDYDYLVVAVGLTHNYFGHDDWARYARGLKSLNDALDIRRQVLLSFEAAEWAETDEEREEWLTFVVVGAGPTGVELAGALAEIARRTMTRQFRRFDPSSAKVILIEGQDRVLPGFTEESSKSAAKQLQKIGVELMLGKRVGSIDRRGVVIDDQRLAARTVVWAAGVKARPLVQTLGAPLDRMGRVQVDKDLRCPEAPEVFVIGDVAAVVDHNGVEVPGLAPAAIQQGKHTANNIRALVAGEPAQPFRYKDKGSLATIGRSAAVAELGRFRFGGFMAWVMWIFIHILFLIGFRNRMSVMFDWALSYLFYQRSARLILELPFAEEAQSSDEDGAGEDTEAGGDTDNAGA